MLTLRAKVWVSNQHRVALTLLILCGVVIFDVKLCAFADEKPSQGNLLSTDKSRRPKISFHDGVAILRGSSTTPEEIRSLRLKHEITDFYLQESDVTFDIFAEITKIKTLKYLDFNASRFEDDGMRSLSDLTGLQVLGLARTNASDKCIEEVNKLEKLVSLIIGASRITTNGLNKLDLKRYSAISIGAIAVSPQDFDVLSFSPKLRVLDVGDTGCDTLTLRRILGNQKDSQLEYLVFCNTKVRSEIASDMNFTVLKEFDMSGVAMNPEMIKGLCRAKNLESLTLNGVGIYDKQYEMLDRMSSLRNFLANYNRVGPKFAVALAKLPQLKFVSVSGTDFTDECLEILSQSKSISGFVARDCNVTEKGIARLCENRYPFYITVSKRSLSENEYDRLTMRFPKIKFVRE